MVWCVWGGEVGRDFKGGGLEALKGQWGKYQDKGGYSGRERERQGYWGGSACALTRSYTSRC